MNVYNKIETVIRIQKNTSCYHGKGRQEGKDREYD